MRPRDYCIYRGGGEGGSGGGVGDCRLCIAILIKSTSLVSLDLVATGLSTLKNAAGSFESILKEQRLYRKWTNLS